LLFQAAEIAEFPAALTPVGFARRDDALLWDV